MRLSRVLTSTRELALAIGNFDGVHRGHQSLLAQTVRVAAERGIEPAVMSFHPLPREAFARMANSPIPVRLMSVTEKVAALSQAGIEALFLPKFDRAFASQSPVQFAQALADMRVRWVITGEDCRFGSRRAGDAALLKSLGASLGFATETLPAVVNQGTRISSTAVREALAKGGTSRDGRFIDRCSRFDSARLNGSRLQKVCTNWQCWSDNHGYSASCVSGHLPRSQCDLPVLV